MLLKGLYSQKKNIIDQLKPQRIVKKAYTVLHIYHTEQSAINTDSDNNNLEKKV